MTSYRTKVFLSQIFCVILFLTIWEVGSRMGFINSFIFSSPSKIMITLWGLCRSGELFVHAWTTILEIIISFSLGTVIAFVMSVAMYRFKFFADTIDPFLTMLNSLPKVALGPIIIIWVGANTNAIITMALLINVIISIINIYNGFEHTDPLRLKLFQSFRATKSQILWKLVVPSNINTIINSLKINISLTLIGVIMGEFLVSKKGIGYLILYGTQVFNLNLVMTGILVLIFISFFLYLSIEGIDKLVKKNELS